MMGSMATLEYPATMPAADVYTDRLARTERFGAYGRVTRVVGLVVEAVGIEVGLGSLCRITNHMRDRSVLAEVVGFHDRTVLLMPLGELDGLHAGASVLPLGRTFGVDVGPALLGRVLNGLGHPIDGKGKVETVERVSLAAEPPNPLVRESIDRPLETGVRAIDGLLTVGRGQRVGIFAGSGVGKSTMLGMIARNAKADVNVIALLGERGREVREFIENSLGEEGLARSVVIVATRAPAMARRAASPASTPSSLTATTSTNRSPTRPARSWTGTSCSPAAWRPRTIFRPSTSSTRRAA
jgi:flagellum-specific ATP synthase